MKEPSRWFRRFVLGIILVAFPAGLGPSTIYYLISR
jgi:hypothetical protein